MSSLVLALVFSSTLGAAPDNRQVVYVGPITARGVPQDTANALASSLATVLARRITADMVVTNAESEKSVLEILQQRVMTGMDSTDEPVDACGARCVCRSSVEPRIRYFVHVEVSQTKPSALEIVAWVEVKGGQRLGAPVTVKAKDAFSAVDQMPTMGAAVVKILEGAPGVKR